MLDTSIKLADIIKGMKQHTDKSLPFLNKNTGAVIYTQRPFLLDAKGEAYVGELLDWQLREMELAYDIVERPDKYITVPSLDWAELRRDFCNAQSEEIRLSLTVAGDNQADFDKVLDQQGLMAEWEKYVNKKAEASAFAFCEEHGLNIKTS